MYLIRPALPEDATALAARAERTFRARFPANYRAEDILDVWEPSYLGALRRTVSTRRYESYATYVGPSINVGRLRLISPWKNSANEITDECCP